MKPRFQSTLPLRGATRVGFASWTPPKFQSTLPLRGATTVWTSCAGTRSNFNPHSPCGERPSKKEEKYEIMGISIHTPLAGSDRHEHRSELRERLFQSTLPLRGATGFRHPSIELSTDFNPHSPCGERPILSDRNDMYLIFQSTLPLRGATAVA